MISELRAHWPLIQQYPWDFLWVFVFGITVGLGIPALWKKMFPTHPRPKGASGAASGSLKRLLKPRFKPSDIQRRCIEVLRYHDHAELSPKQVYESIGKVIPLADIDRALNQLEEQDWATWAPNYYGDGLVFRLAGLGIDYAIENKMQVGPTR